MLTADVAWLYARQRFGVHPGLGRVRALLDRLGNPQQQFETVLVGGTNGKGSTAATLAAIMQASGRRTALFTSPHLTHLGERFVVGGQEVSHAHVVSGLAQVRPHAEAVEATFFEIVVALGCSLFAELGAQSAVMEVGLGGRLDATNVLEPVLSVITGVALDHTEVLGDTLEAIAAEKAGILRPGRPAVTGVAAALLPLLRASGADLWELGEGDAAKAQSHAQARSWQGWDVTLSSPLGRVAFQTPLLGPHGARNAALAALAAQRLGVPAAAITRGAAQTRWPGRLEVLPWHAHPDAQPRQVLLDGAHNPDGAAALVTALRGLGVGQVPVIFGAAGDKDVAGVGAALREVTSEVILTRALNSPRAASPQALAALFEGVPLHLTNSPQEALSALPPGLGLACGSLYLIGELRPLLLGEVGEDGERWQ